MPRALPKPSPVLSLPVAVGFVLLTSAALGTMFWQWLSFRQLVHHHRVVSAVVTHKWRATRIGDNPDYYIGYAYVDGEGLQQQGSARIAARSAPHYKVGEPVRVMVAVEAPAQSTPQNQAHVATVEKLPRRWPIVATIGLMAVGAWAMLGWRIRRAFERPQAP